jgi:hypothetical protein
LRAGKLFYVNLSLAAEVDHFFASQECPVCDGSRRRDPVHKFRVADLVRLCSANGRDDSSLSEIPGNLRRRKSHLFPVCPTIRRIKSLIAASQIGEVRINACIGEQGHHLRKSELSRL